MSTKPMRDAASNVPLSLSFLIPSSLPPSLYLSLSLSPALTHRVWILRGGGVRPQRGGQWQAKSSQVYNILYQGVLILYRGV